MLKISADGTEERFQVCTVFDMITFTSLVLELKDFIFKNNKNILPFYCIHGESEQASEILTHS